MPRRLLIRPGAIGDVILSLPAMEGARGQSTEVWAPRAVLPLLRFADRTRALADTGLDWVAVVNDDRAQPALRALAEFDSIYSWYGSAREEFRAAVAHLPFTFFPALPPPPGVPRIEVPTAPREDFIVIHPFASFAKWPGFARFPFSGVPDRRRVWRAPCDSTISTSWPAGCRERAPMWATTQVSPILRRRWARP
jgi:heptosyltransferase III